MADVEIKHKVLKMEQIRQIDGKGAILEKVGNEEKTFNTRQLNVEV